MIKEQLSRVHSARNPGAKMERVSAHHAIRSDTTSDPDLREQNLKIKIERNCKQAFIKACRQGREPPPRADHYRAYGYTLHIPTRMPYELDPCHLGSGGLYSSNPFCATFIDGASGHCAAGSCGGSVAARTCGGDGNCTSANAEGCDGRDGIDGGSRCVGHGGCG